MKVFFLHFELYYSTFDTRNAHLRRKRSKKFKVHEGVCVRSNMAAIRFSWRSFKDGSFGDDFFTSAMVHSRADGQSKKIVLSWRPSKV
jgi:hypothetical protein